MKRDRRSRGTLLLAALALAACTKQEEKDPHRLKADEAFAVQRFAEAATEYDLSLQAKPNQGIDVWKKGAFCYMKAGNYDKAAELLSKTVDLATTPADKAEAYRNIAGMYLQGANRLDKAETYFAEVLKIDPKDEQTLTWLAEIASQLGGARLQTAPAVPEHLDHAIERYDQLIALKPDSMTAWANKRIALVKYATYLKQVAAGSPGAAADAGAVMTAAQAQAKLAELTPQFEACNKKLGELAKAAKRP